MRLTNTLLYYVVRKKVKGSLMAGKKQYIPFVYPWEKAKAVKEMLHGQENLDLLSTPWLTEEEEHSWLEYRKSLGLEEKEKRELRIAERKEAMPDNVIFTETSELDRVKRSAVWE